MIASGAAPTAGARTAAAAGPATVGPTEAEAAPEAAVGVPLKAALPRPAVVGWLATTNTSPTRRAGSTTLSRYVPNVVSTVAGGWTSTRVAVAPGNSVTGWPSMITTRSAPKPVPVMVSTPVSGCSVTL